MLQTVSFSIFRPARRAVLASRRALPVILGTLMSVLSVFPLLVLMGLAAAPADAEGRPTGAWIEILDGQGQPAESVSALDLTVIEPDGTATASGLGRPLTVSQAKGRLTLYFDQALSGKGALRRAADALSDSGRLLAALGEVEVVSASVDDDPQAQVRSSDPLVLSERLGRMALTESSDGTLYTLRERALEAWRQAAVADPPATLDEKVEGLLRAVQEEQDLVRNRLRRLVTWTTRNGSAGAGSGPGPKILLVVLEGFDLEPVEFYAGKVDGITARALRDEAVKLPSLEDETRALARTLSASGWIVLPVTMPITRLEQKAAEFTNIQTGDEDQQTVVPGITLRPGRLFNRKDKDDEEGEDDEPQDEVQLVDPQEPLTLLAEGSGGELVTSDLALRDALGRMDQRRWVTWNSSVDHEDGLAAVEVRVKNPGWTVRGPRWRSLGTPTGLADLRLDRVLTAGVEGDLTLAAVLEVPNVEDASDDPSEPAQPVRASLDVRLDLHDLEGEALRSGGTQADMRVSVQALGMSGEPLILREVVPGQDLSSGLEWRFQRRLDLPADATAVAVLVEELGSGIWGGRRATVVRAAGEEAAAFLPSPTVLEIQRPDEILLRGRVKFDISVYDQRIRRLSFLLDDREVASVRRAPWTTRLDLGRTPRRQTLTVIGYDGQGVEAGRDSAVLNGGDAGLGVEIVRPTSSKGIGPVEVEAEVSVPLERKLDRVLFFWNNEQVATLFAGPFRHNVVVPEDRPVGYVRVVALLDDGSLAEDVLFMNGPEAGERLDVNLVELYVVVTDKDGRPVRGLTKADFAVQEEGVRQEIATFSDAADLPLTLGMAIDSSASMFVKLPRVQKAASDFLYSTFGDQDRAFVIDFDSVPRLARGTTRDVERVVQSIYGLEASGRTALWESVVFSLVQLQGVRGRKALVVFSDGADEDDQFPFRSCMRIAKEMGVPIYMILMKKEPKENAAMGLLSRSFTSRARRLAEATGGRVFYAKEYDNLGEVYDEIEVELRSQYLLTYYPKGTDDKAGWRDVDVDVSRQGLKPRTLTGYWQ